MYDVADDTFAFGWLNEAEFYLELSRVVALIRVAEKSKKSW